MSGLAVAYPGRTDLTPPLPCPSLCVTGTMSWAVAPGLIIIGGGFAAAGGLFAGIDWLTKAVYDKVRAFGLETPWLKRGPSSGRM